MNKADDGDQLRTLIWYTADGRDYQVRQMETSHIKNCMRLIKRKTIALGRPWRTRYLARFAIELRHRGELSSSSFAEIRSPLPGGMTDVLMLFNDHVERMMEESPDLRSNPWGNS